jgi:AMMECR1 domain-containing protein
LRGCIGSLQAHRALDQDVRANAVAAAFRDPRFAPLTVEELPRTRVEVSLLTAPCRCASRTKPTPCANCAPMSMA